MDNVKFENSVSLWSKKRKTYERCVTDEYHLAPRINNRNVLTAGTLRFQRFADFATGLATGRVSEHSHEHHRDDAGNNSNGQRNQGAGTLWLAGWLAVRSDLDPRFNCRY